MTKKTRPLLTIKALRECGKTKPRERFLTVKRAGNAEDFYILESTLLACLGAHRPDLLARWHAGSNDRD